MWGVQFVNLGLRKGCHFGENLYLKGAREGLNTRGEPPCIYGLCRAFQGFGRTWKHGHWRRNKEIKRKLWKGKKKHWRGNKGTVGSFHGTGEHWLLAWKEYSIRIFLLSDPHYNLWHDIFVVSLASQSVASGTRPGINLFFRKKKLATSLLQVLMTFKLI